MTASACEHAPSASARPRHAALRLLGVRLDPATRAEALAAMADWIAEARALRDRGAPPRTRQVVTLNPEMVMAARADAALRAAIAGADLVVADGAGVVLAARLRGARGVERVTGIDTLEALAGLAAARGWRLYLLGAPPGVAAAAAGRLSARYPGLVIAGARAGSPDARADAESAGLVRASGADIVAVAYGSPAQERWIARNRARLGAGVALGVGGALDYLSGEVARAPRWMRRMGCEWAYRLWRQPWRWRRMLALPRFALAALGEAAILRAREERRPVGRGGVRG